jgi:hypothetical protein
MKYYLSIISTLCALALLLVPNHRAEAHFLQISGSIGAVLHIDPDDDPIAGQVSAFYFEFKDESKKFVVQDCNCSIIITDLTTKEKTAIPQKDIGYIQTTTLIFKYTFPKKGIYRVEVVGPFTLSYDIRVDRESIAQETKVPSHTLHYILFGGAILATIIVVIRDKRREMKV